MKIKQGYLYSEHHLWVVQEADGVWLAGITDYAQDLLGDIVFVELPLEGGDVSYGQPCGLVESVKTGSDLHAPLDGKIVGTNTTLNETPEILNDNPYDAWIFKILASPESAAKLMTADAYQVFLAVD